jgi:hypothetical protein
LGLGAPFKAYESALILKPGNLPSAMSFHITVALLASINLKSLAEFPLREILLQVVTASGLKDNTS